MLLKPPFLTAPASEVHVPPLIWYSPFVILIGVSTETPETVMAGDTTVLPCAASVIDVVVSGSIEVGAVEIGVVGRALPRTKRAAYASPGRFSKLSPFANETSHWKLALPTNAVLDQTIEFPLFGNIVLLIAGLATV